MKKIFILVVALALITGAAFAGDNQSAKYIRSITRDASTDSIDAAYFNPAGTAFLEDGTYIQINGQTVYLNYSHVSAVDYNTILGGFGPSDGGTYEMENWVPFVPSAYLGYKKDNWSFFISYAIPEGGGSLDYDDLVIGNSVPLGYLQGSLTASSSTHAIGVGGAFSLGDFFAFGGRWETSIATYAVEGEITSSYITGPGDGFLNGTAELTANGIGMGAVLGVNVKPIDDMNIAFTVETRQDIPVEIEDSESTNPFLLNAVTDMVGDADRPWKIRAAVDYMLPFDLGVSAGFKYSFWDLVDEDAYVNSWSANLGLRYLMGDSMEFSVGGSYATGNREDDTLDASFMNPELDSVTVAGGFGWEPMQDLMLDFGVLVPFYLGDDGTAYTDMEKSVVVIGYGVSYKF